ncbi:P-loop containing nucleoside triphosphate hydrolase protein [Aspergillus egyptiacus]|nr:P-loop containing nucleoside triphosphate hydrolase protein [Aspergillus egyptiacus]
MAARYFLSLGSRITHRRLANLAIHNISYPRAPALYQPNCLRSFSISSPIMKAPGSDDAQAYATMAGQLDSQLLHGLGTMGITSMTPVQQRVLTELPTWRSDCLVQAKTGTGKTFAFLLPALHCLLQGETAPPRGKVAILIITPTRELAQQIATSCDQVVAHLGVNRPECHIAVGGTARASTLKRFLNGKPSILVATPGRLIDYLSEPETAERLSHVKTVVLDEADRMLEQGFIDDVKKILSLIPPKSTAGWQGMCFSATLPPKVKDVVNIVLNPGYSHISTIDENEAPTHERVPQYHVLIPSVADTFTTLTSLLNRETKNCNKAIIFGATANMVALFAAAYSQGRLTSLPVFEIHSRLNQTTRTRVTAQFKEASSGILFASDVVGRGMDFPNVDLVIQVSIPTNGEQYIHRVGRTARAGNAGRAVLLLTEAESFFLQRNRHLPITPHPETEAIKAEAASHAEAVEQAMHAVDDRVKSRAYAAYLGFLAGSGLLKALRLDKAGLVRLANEFAVDAMACPEPPPIDKKTVGKMGMKGVPGFNYGRPEELHDSRPARHSAGGGKRKAQEAFSPTPGGNHHHKNGGQRHRGGRGKRGHAN